MPQFTIKQCQACSSLGGPSLCNDHIGVPFGQDIKLCNACSRKELCQEHFDRLTELSTRSQAGSSKSAYEEREQMMKGQVIDVDTMPGQIIRHQEAPKLETDISKERVEVHQETPLIETHLQQPIVKEHQRDILHEHHQNVEIEHHKQVVHEHHQPVIHEHIQPVIYQESITEIHKPIIHEQHQDVIHEIHMPVIHEQHRDLVSDEYRGPIIQEQQMQPIVQTEVMAPRVESETMKPILLEETYQDQRHVVEQSLHQEQQQHPITLVKSVDVVMPPQPEYVPVNIIVPEEKGFGDKIMDIFSDIKHSVTENR
ncbi:hypothetical protein FGO68_gene12739 [Halteria grandinella]|uniref:Uncharacterized protein n=1 Tax=Halteria grandinella TaxID=5974 RepID=A0A8J8NL45_HALGN|nr:hypothetical protein FGO68_gene12739 [Halteria grandinella]